MEDAELVEGLVLEQKASHAAGGLSRVEKAKIGLIQFCISPPKTDVSSPQCLNVCCTVCSNSLFLADGQSGNSK